MKRIEELNVLYCKRKIKTCNQKRLLGHFGWWNSKELLFV